jgi:hypothetical protein
MITKNEISELKLQFDHLTNYYSNFDFPILSNHFRTVVNILNEMENQCVIIENLTARLQVAEAELAILQQEPSAAPVEETKEETPNEAV